ncbi:MAG TPA: MBL fold metallo-hydrolase RNA specificity domain-containing protein [Nitrososphaeraceae archaeon]|nr:MBL fold metallo-hydrolase RNA specificity domain-containing protein [Nitrososphaeraceae archaeon]
MKIQILGAAKEVGRSAFLVSNGNSNVLMDYGVLLKKEPQFPIHIKPKDLNAIVLSHAHLDHSGFIPSLFASSSKLPVLATNPTIELSQLLIEDMIKISGFYLPFENIDLHNMIKCHTTLEYRQPYNINDIFITLYESGHVLGGSTIVVENNKKRIFYTGDINTRGSQILRPADLNFDEINLMIIESTYSQTNQMPRPQAEKELLEFAHKIIDNGGTLFVPAFSVERAQEIACVLKAHKFPHKIVMDGMALKVNEIMLKYPEYIKDPEIFRNYIEEVEWIKDWKRRKQMIKEPCVIISPAGMLVGGSAIFYMQHIMMSDKNGIALVSYQGENTPGRMLLDKGTFKLNGRIKKCLAEVKQFEFSGHNSRDELFEILDSVKGNPKVLTVHGDGESCIRFAEEIKEKYGFDAIAPDSGDIFTI